MINRFSQLIFVLLGFVGLSLCDANLSLTEDDDDVTFRISLLLHSVKAFNATDFTESTEAQTFVEKRAIRYILSSIHGGSIEGVYFVGAEEAIVNTSYYYVNYDVTAEAHTGLTRKEAQSQMDYAATYGKLTFHFNEDCKPDSKINNVCNEFGLSVFTTAQAARYEIIITLETECGVIFSYEDFQNTLQNFHEYINIEESQGFTNVGIANVHIDSNDCQDKSRKLSGAANVGRRSQVSLITYELKGDGCTANCPNEGIPSIATLDRPLMLRNLKKRRIEGDNSAQCPDSFTGSPMPDSDEFIDIFNLNQSTNDNIAVHHCDPTSGKERVIGFEPLEISSVEPLEISSVEPLGISSDDPTA